MYKVLLKKSIEKSLSGLPKEIRGRIGLALDQLADLGTKASQVKNQTPLSGYRKRVGDYRILFDCEEDITSNQQTI